MVFNKNKYFLISANNFGILLPVSSRKIMFNNGN